jgi:hypothetical protein
MDFCTDRVLEKFFYILKHLIQSVCFAYPGMFLTYNTQIWVYP